MSSTVLVIPPQARFNLVNAAGNVVTPPDPPFQRLTATMDNWAVIRCTPTNATSSVDLVNGTSSNMGSPVVDKHDAFAIVGARILILTAEPIASPSAPLLVNTVIAKVNSIEVGRFTVDVSTQYISWDCKVLPDDAVDTRFALDGTNDLTFVLTNVDPNLRIYAMLGGTSS